MQIRAQFDVIHMSTAKAAYSQVYGDAMAMMQRMCGSMESRGCVLRAARDRKLSWSVGTWSRHMKCSP